MGVLTVPPNSKQRAKHRSNRNVRDRGGSLLCAGPGANGEGRELPALAVPAALVAAPMPQEAKVQVRVYDSEHKDYHNWDDHENAAWIRFQDENHRKHHEFTKADKKEQAEYWNWRHSHPD